MSRTNPYIKTTWVDEETEVNADNLNNLERGVYAAHSAVIAAEDALAETKSSLLESNTVDTVKKAVSDSLGRAIDATYATKTYVDNANNLNVKHSDVVNNLTDTSTTNPLSAAQGKELQRQINELYAFLDTATEDVDTTINRMQDIFAFLDSVNDNQTLLDLLDAKMAYTSLVKNLTTNNDDLPLAASQGYLLQQQVNTKSDKPLNITASDLRDITPYTQGDYTVTLSDDLTATIVQFGRDLKINWQNFRNKIAENIPINTSILVRTNTERVSNTYEYHYNAVGYDKNITVTFYYANIWHLVLSFEELPTKQSINAAITSALTNFLNSPAFENKVKAIVDKMYADVSEVEY